MNDSGALSIWTVYDHPRDYPHCFVARRWEVRDGKEVPTEDLIVAPVLDAVRSELSQRGLVCLTRAPGDDPKIVETWL